MTTVEAELTREEPQGTTEQEPKGTEEEGGSGAVRWTEEEGEVERRHRPQLMAALRLQGLHQVMEGLKPEEHAGNGGMRRQHPLHGGSTCRRAQPQPKPQMP